jgi:hypothetical protein
MSANPTNCDMFFPTCCLSGFPQNLHATISAPAMGPMTACTAIDGKVANLAFMGFSAFRHTWKGTVDAGSCGTLTVIFEVAEEAPGASCDQYITVMNASGQVCFGMIHNPPQCPIVSHAFGPTGWNNSNCNCCTFPQNNAHVTVTVTP